MRKGMVFFLLLSVCWDLSAEPVSPNGATGAASFFLDAQKLRQEVRATMGKGRLVSEKPLAAVSVSDTKALRGAKAQTIAYVVELAPEGFIILSADTDIRPILGYSFSGKFPYQDARENALLHLVQWDVEAKLNAVEAFPNQMREAVASNKTLWERYASEDQALVDEVATAEEYGPLIKFATWDQGSTIFWQDNYNQYCPLNPTHPGERCVVGCVATAVAQILYYWQYPRELEFGYITDPYTSWQWQLLLSNQQEKGEWWPIGIPEDYWVWDFPGFATLNDELDEIDYDDSMQEKAYLSFAVGIKLEMDYGRQSGSLTNAPVYTRELGYGSALQVRDSNGCWDDDTRAHVVRNMKDGWPVNLGIRGVAGGHSVIVHGYKSTGEFYLNLGWGGTGDCWYFLPAIDTRLCEDREGKYYFDLVHTVVYDIAPHSGWSQVGGDQYNCFRSVYGIPTTEPHVKYERDTNGRVEGFVIGEGNQICATHDPEPIINDIYHPRITVVDQYGNLLHDKEVTQTNQTISPPVQAPNGDVFFGAGDGVYRFRSRTASLQRVYWETGEMFYGDCIPRVDEDGYMYFHSDTALVSINQTGIERWRWPVPSGGVLYGVIPSIDPEKDNVYIGYWKDSTDEAILVCLNRSSGNPRYDTKFGNVITADRGVSTPVVGSDGTVYASVWTKLYALTPGTSSFSQKWVSPEKNIRHMNIALGFDDSIYTEYWTLDGGNYYVTLAKLKPSDGTVAWEKFEPDVGEYSTTKQPICAANDVVVFPVYWDSSPDPKIQFYAYSTSGDSLWDYTPSRIRKDYDYAVAPGAALCIAQKDGIIVALSDGPLGDPDEGGMGWADNNPPSAPFEPIPAHSAENLERPVTLEWQCFDRDTLEQNPGRQLKYDLLLGELNPVDTASAMLLPVANGLTTTSWVAEALNPGRGYAWQVRATDGQAVSESPVWVFSTMPFKATAINLGADNTITISWHGATNNVIIERSETLSPESWEEHAGPVSGSSWSGPTPSGSINFFRVKTQ